MVIETSKGYFEILKNVKNAFNEEIFEEYYIEEYFDKYDFLVVDIADGKPRIKGFSKNNKSDNYFHNIPDYILESCNFLPIYYVLKRINQKEFENHKNDSLSEEVTKEYGSISPIEKENFDKDSLSLTQTKRENLEISIEQKNIGEIKLYKLPKDIEKDIERDKKRNFKTNFGYNKNKKSRTKEFTHKNS